MSAVLPPIVPVDVRNEAQRLLRRYLQEIIEPFHLCPWAKATRTRDELWVEIAATTSLATLATQVAQFVRASEPHPTSASDATADAIADASATEANATAITATNTAPVASIGMLVFAGSGMSPRKLLELRDLLLAHAGVQEKVGAWPGLVIADFHPAAAEPDLRTPSRLLPFIRRSPDPMLQIARRSTIESVTNAGANMITPSEQLAALIGTKMLIGQSTSDEIAARNHQTVQEQLAQVQAASDSIARDRAATYERLGLL